jgi:hypothetical protein
VIHKAVRNSVLIHTTQLELVGVTLRRGREAASSPRYGLERNGSGFHKGTRYGI